MKPYPNLCEYDKNECPPKRSPKKKDTERWCKGKPGVQHVVDWVDKKIITVCYKELICTKCGKVFSSWFPRLWGKHKQFVEASEEIKRKKPYLIFQ